MRKSFHEVNHILNRVMSRLGLDRRLREHTFFGLWTTFVDGHLGERSRPLYIDAEHNLVVSVADAATGQELSMRKGKVMLRLAPAARSFGIEIRGIRLDLKHFHSASTLAEHPLASDARLPQPEDADLQQIQLSDADEQEIKQLAIDLERQNIDADNRKRVIRLHERELRLRAWRLAHNYPVCQRCSVPVERLHRLANRGEGGGQSMVCIACLYAD